MRSVETFPSKHMYPYLSLVKRGVTEIYFNIDKMHWWFGLNDLFSSLFPDNSWCPYSISTICICGTQGAAETLEQLWISYNQVRPEWIIGPKDEKNMKIYKEYRSWGQYWETIQNIQEIDIVWSLRLKDQDQAFHISRRLTSWSQLEISRVFTHSTCHTTWYIYKKNCWRRC